MDYSAYLVPLLLAFVALFGLGKRVNVYEALTQGAQEGVQTAGRISNALSAPRAARTPATVVGRSWMEAVLSTTNLHSSPSARPLVCLAMRRAAWMPRGVAALPRPSRFADTLPERASSGRGSQRRRFCPKFGGIRGRTWIFQPF